MGFIFRPADESRRAIDLHIILNQDAVQKDRDPRGSGQIAIIIEAGGFVKYIVSLPLSRFSGRVGQRNVLLVDTARHPVHIGWIFPVVQHLYFITLLKEHPAVPAALSFSLYKGRCAPFDMKLDIPEVA